MGNKPIKHTELDNLIRDILMYHKAASKVEWKDIDNLLPKKPTTIDGPLADFKFSLNSFSGLLAVSSSSVNMKSALLFAKKWSVALYVLAGTVVVGTGTYLVYNSIAKNPLNTSVNKVVLPPVIKETAKQEVKSGAPQNVVSTASATTPASETAEQVTTVTKNLPRNITSGSTVTENPSVKGSALIKTTQAAEKDESSNEPIQLKTEEQTQTGSFDFATNPETTKPDTTINVSQNSTVKKGKVLYYKESLSLDKLEQQLSTDKKDNTTEVKTSTEDKQIEKKGLFKKRRK